LFYKDILIKLDLQVNTKKNYVYGLGYMTFLRVRDIY